MPGNDIHVRTVANSIILTGSVASAGDAQKALDIATGFVNDTAVLGLADGDTSIGGGPERRGRQQRAELDRSDRKVINSLTIRGLDQVSLRVTVAKSAATSSSSLAST